MKFLRYPHLKPVEEHTVVTIGNFDGVHLGHQQLIGKTIDYANKFNLESVVVTMNPLACQYFAGNDLPMILTPFRQKFEILKAMNVDWGCFLNFNDSLANCSAEQFVNSIILKGLNAKHVIVGDDFRYGKNRQGDFCQLQEMCSANNVSVEQISTFAKNGRRVSSSLIRDLLIESKFRESAVLLGRYYSIAGKISQGEKLGRQLGFPTINININQRVLPVHGIFCVKVRFGNGNVYNGAASLGTRPTVGGVSKILEVHILDFDKQVYGENVEVFFHHKLRNEVKFGSLEELKRHINEDVLQTRLFFENNI